jgi:pimeloyl-ACP methyl ester carboxylesterase
VGARFSGADQSKADPGDLGDKDPYISPSFAERFNARKVVHLPVGHWAPVEAPAECADAIAEFLADRAR